MIRYELINPIDYTFKPMLDIRPIFNIKLLLYFILLALNSLTKSFIYGLEQIACRDFLQINIF